MIKFLFLTFSIYLSRTASANTSNTDEWVRSKCYTFENPIMVTNSKCGGVKTCVMSVGCSLISADYVREMGGLNKLPAGIPELYLTSINTTAFCDSKNGQCPTAEKCVDDQSVSAQSAEIVSDENNLIYKEGIVE